MPNTALLLGTLILIFAALAGLFHQTRTSGRRLDTAQRDITENQRELTKISTAPQTIKQRIANTAKDNNVDEFIEIDSDQWLDDQDHRDLLKLEPL